MMTDANQASQRAGARSGGLGVRLRKELLNAAPPLFLSVGAFALARAPLAAQGPACLGVLRGPLGFVLLGLGLAVTGARLLQGRFRGGVPTPTALVLLSSLVLVGVGQHYARYLRPTGDEPHYLVMAQSLWREGDLDLRDNYERRDFLEYTPGPMSPHYGAPRADGRPFPLHSPGLPLLLAPAYALGGRRGAVVLLALLAAALGALVLRLAEQLTGGSRAAAWAWGVAMGPPLAFFAFHVYAELPATLALAGSLALLVGRRPGVAGAVGAALLASALPWLHLKMLPVAVALALVGLLRLHGRPRLTFFAVATVMAGGFLAFYHGVYGSLGPLGGYGGVPQELSTSRPVAAAAGLLLDRSFGLLPHAPAYLLALAGLPLLLRRRWPELWPHLLVAAAVLVPALSWRMWWGGQCPPARFLVPLLPLLALAVAVRAAGPASGLWRWRFTLLGLGLSLFWWMTREPGRLLLVNRGARPTRVWASLSGETPVGRYLPSLVAGEAEDWKVASVWLVALLVLLVLDRLARHRAGIDAWFRGLGLPVVLLLLVGLAIDGWARPVGRSSGGGPRASAQARAAP